MDDSVADLRDWFFDNYEKPAEYLEQQYLHLYGCHYIPRRELFKYWGEEYPVDILNAASGAIDQETGISHWAVARWRMEHLIENPSRNEQYKRILRGLSNLESLLDEIKGPAGIGHNYPPEEMDGLLSLRDATYIEHLITEIRSRGDDSSATPASIRSAPSKLRSIRNGLLAALAACALGAAEEVGTQVVQHYEVGKKIGVVMEKLADDLEQWFKTSRSPTDGVDTVETSEFSYED